MITDKTKGAILAPEKEPLLRNMASSAPLVLCVIHNVPILRFWGPFPDF